DAPAPWVEGLRVPPGAHERLLGEGVGEAGVASNRHRNPVDAPPKATNELVGGVEVADSESGEDSLVRQIPHVRDTDSPALGITAETSVTTVIAERLPAVPASMNTTSSTHAVGLRRWVWLTARGLGALSLLAVGEVHLQQYQDLYSAIPTIGRLFVVNFVAATILGVALFVPFERLSHRCGALAVPALALR